MDTEFLDAFSQEVWNTTYKYHTDQNVDDTFRRISRAVASVEKTDELKKQWEANFYELLSGFKMCAGGRILANAGTEWKGTTLMNCFVGPKPKYDQDSIEGIFGTLLSQVKTLKSEGGWGMNFSFIRPRGSFIYGIGVETPGAVKYMELFDKSSDVITAGSGQKSKKKESKGKIRKGAMMGVLDVWHPDIEEFIAAKQTENRLSKFNISVNCTNEFMDRVTKIHELQNLKLFNKSMGGPENGGTVNDEIEILNKWDLIFPDTRHVNYKTEWNGDIAAWKAKGYPVKVYKTAKVTDLWEQIMQSTYKRNDPGVLFLDRANETHCWNYGGPDAHIAATNPCGEQCLPFGFVCNLASMNLTQFVKHGRFDFTLFSKYVAWAVRFLDNVNDLTDAPLPEYAQSIKSKRRIGLGVMGWGSMLYLMKIRFGSDEAELLKEKIMTVLTHTGIDTSIDLAEEKGMFEGCDPVKHSQHPYFISIGLSPESRAKMAKFGIRNSALFSIQPTGNTSIFANVVSGGLEPVFLHEYIRTVIVNHCPEDLKPLCPKYWEGEFKETPLFKFVKEGDETILKGVHKGTVYKIDKNRGLTKEVECSDYAVRILRERKEWKSTADWAVTTNDLKVEDHIRDMTGFAQWIDSSMSKTVNLPNDYPYEKFKDIYLNAYKSGYLKGITTYRDGTMTTVLSAAKKDGIQKTNSPKRPDTLEGELHHFTVDGKKYYAAVGLFGEDNLPFEIFTGVNQDRKEIFIPKQIKKGIIKKIGSGKYTFIGEDNEEYDLTNGHANDTADAFSRLLSVSLRHGADISFIVEQLTKTQGNMVSFSKVLARALKKYIKEGTQSTEACPDCGKNYIFVEGCKKCPNCGNSKCG